MNAELQRELRSRALNPEKTTTACTTRRLGTSKKEEKQIKPNHVHFFTSVRHHIRHLLFSNENHPGQAPHSPIIPSIGDLKIWTTLCLDTLHFSHRSPSREFDFTSGAPACIETSGMYSSPRSSFSYLGNLGSSALPSIRLSTSLVPSAYRCRTTARPPTRPLRLIFAPPTPTPAPLPGTSVLPSIYRLQSTGLLSLLFIVFHRLK